MDRYHWQKAQGRALGMRWTIERILSRLSLRATTASTDRNTKARLGQFVAIFPAIALTLFLIGPSGGGGGALHWPKPMVKVGILRRLAFQPSAAPSRWGRR